jgi:hypothetical protein
MTKSITAEYTPCYNSANTLSFFTAQHMVLRLLTVDRLEKESQYKKELRCAKYTKEELAQKLGITTNELKKFKLPHFYNSIVGKISMPLISLYCATKWVDGEYKPEK